MSTARPFRTGVRPIPADAIEQANRRLGLKGARRFSASALWDVQRAGSAARSRLYSWIEHPDEDVAATLARRAFDSPPWKREDVRYVGDALIARALRDAQAEGLAWTPLLDAIASRHLWPHVFTTEPGTETYEWPGLPGDEPRELPHFRNAETQIEPLLEWIASETDPAALRDLFSFSYARIFDHIAEHARAIDETVVRMLLGRQDRLAVLLTSNPHLSRDLADQLHAWALGSLVGRDARGRSEYGFAVGRPSPLTAVDVILALDETHGVPDSTWDDLLAVVTSWTPEPTARWQCGPANEAQRDAAWAALMEERTAEYRTPRRLLALFDRVRHEPERVLQLVRDPNAPIDLRLRALAETRVQRVREFLAADATLRHHPGIRKMLEQSNAAAVLRPLLVDAPDAEWPALFMRLARSSWEEAQAVLREQPARVATLSIDQLRSLLNAAPPIGIVKWIGLLAGSGMVPEAYALLAERMPAAFEAAATEDPAASVEALETLPDAALALLRPEDLAPLVTSENRAVRVRAITQLSRLRAPEAETPSGRSPRA